VNQGSTFQNLVKGLISMPQLAKLELNYSGSHPIEAETILLGKALPNLQKLESLALNIK